MKTAIETSDVQRGGEFVAANGDRLSVVSDGGGLALVNLSAARLVTRNVSNVSDSEIAGILNASGAVPRWLHEAREAERRRIADLD